MDEVRRDCEDREEMTRQFVRARCEAVEVVGTLLPDDDSSPETLEDLARCADDYAERASYAFREWAGTLRECARIRRLDMTTPEGGASGVKRIAG